jgi:predicted CopG family antitoxin
VYIHEDTMSKTIRVADETHAELARLKGDDETFDELISRLLRQRREAVRDGAGLWVESDAAPNARDAREQLKQDLGQ